MPVILGGLALRQFDINLVAQVFSTLGSVTMFVGAGLMWTLGGRSPVADLRRLASGESPASSWRTESIMAGAEPAFC